MSRLRHLLLKKNLEPISAILDPPLWINLIYPIPIYLKLVYIESIVIETLIWVIKGFFPGSKKWPVSYEIQIEINTIGHYKLMNQVLRTWLSKLGCHRNINVDARGNFKMFP